MLLAIKSNEKNRENVDKGVVALVGRVRSDRIFYKLWTPRRVTAADCR